MSHMTDPTVQASRAVRLKVSQLVEEDVIITGILDARARPAVEVARWDQATNLIVRVPSVEHADHAAGGAMSWDWLIDAQVAERSVVGIKQCVVYYTQAGPNSVNPPPGTLTPHEAIVASRVNNDALPALELHYYDEHAGQMVHVPSAQHRDTAPETAVNRWRGLGE